MNEQELARMVVRLLGDGSSYVRMLEQAKQSTEQAASFVQQHAAQIENLSKSLESYASNAVSALASFGAANYLRSAFEAFQGREQGMVRLSSALRANGREVEATTAEYRAFAKALADTSTASVGEVLSALRAAETHNLTGAAAERAAQNAMALAYATHGTAEGMEHMVRMTAAMEAGDTRMAMRMGRMVEQLRHVRDESEFVARYNRLLATGMDTAAQSANTSYGAVLKLSNAYKALRADLGEVVAEAVKPYVKSITEVVDWLRSLDKGTKTAIVGTIAFVAAVLALGPALKTLSFFGAMSLNPVTVGIVAVAAALGIVVQRLGGVRAAWEYASAALKAFWERNEAVISSVLIGAATIGAIVLVWRTLALTVGLVNTVLTALHVYQAAGIVLWVAWTAAVLAAKGVMALFNLQYAVYTALIAFATSGTALLTVATVTAKVATWLWNVALTAMNALLTAGIGVVLAFAGTLAVLFGGFVVAGAVIAGTVGALTELFGLLRQVPATSGPIAVIGELFREWYDAVKDIVRAAKVDLPLAGQIAAAAWALGVAQIRALWPPLWQFVKAGWEAVGDLVWQQFALRAIRFAAVAANNFFSIFDPILRRLGLETFQSMTDSISRNVESALEASIGLAESRLAYALAKFGYTETEEVAAARAELARLRGQIPAAEARARSAQEQTNATIEGGRKEAEKLDAVLRSSADALARIAAYRERNVGVFEARSASGSSPTPAAQAPGNGPVSAASAQQQESGTLSVNILREIRDFLVRQFGGEPSVTITAAPT